MKWTLFIQQKMKVAALLLSIMFFVILTNVLGSHNLENINRSANSIYKDRLIPATDVYYISDHLHRKKALLESYLVVEGKNAGIVNELKQLNQRITERITHFETTYLVNVEGKFISHFKANNKQYNGAEQEVLHLVKSGNMVQAKAVFDSRVKTSHEKNIATLGKLMNIQSDVGKDLIKDSQFYTSSFNLLSTLQLILAGVIGALIVKLVMAARLTTPQTEKYTMN
ncbi:hypothetical protein DJ568_16030 [Mucilaginibacter hurinus]|uniref:Chemotaxis methyl-accepting receptor HlyB-like 4HB MCP domain-containing protein n=1 Tax=Mucilaginibacter hurinus TaxID=2201324 RepID=A0A367GLL5_9SPHI|nr:MCP four helix bundle domain-containing protein [Mucilaginibacter hurinus]RCH53746.1 hypothetical protein DJ568_16030 [Mucilaginibacter hurinus]